VDDGVVAGGERHLHPAVVLALAPLVALDEALGFGSPGTAGRLVHLQGHLFVLMSLALLGMALEVSGVSASAAAIALATTGFAWPVWSSSASGGAESILMALCAACLLGSELSRRRGEGTGTWLRAVSLFLLPWTHASGPLVAVALVAGEAAFGLLRRPRELAGLASALLLGLASMVLLWNQGYHGNWWAGGYALGHRHHLVGGRPFGTGLARYLWASIPAGPATILLAAGFLRTGSRDRRPIRTAALMAVALSVLFAQEPVYNLAPGLLTSRLLLAANGLVSFHWFIERTGRYYLGPYGLYYPAVLWVKRLIDGGPSFATLAPPLALLAALAAFSRRLDRIVQADEPRPLGRPPQVADPEER
jgi:hypothetical protein